MLWWWAILAEVGYQHLVTIFANTVWDIGGLGYNSQKPGALKFNHKGSLALNEGERKVCGASKGGLPSDENYGRSGLSVGKPHHCV